MDEILITKIGSQFRNTALGLMRIRRNLKLGNIADCDIESLLRSIILSTEIDNIESKGKNHYFRNSQYNAILTINKHSFTIITAKQIKVE